MRPLWRYMLMVALVGTAWGTRAVPQEQHVRAGEEVAVLDTVFVLPDVVVTAVREPLWNDSLMVRTGVRPLGMEPVDAVESLSRKGWHRRWWFWSALGVGAATVSYLWVSHSRPERGTLRVVIEDVP